MDARKIIMNFTVPPSLEDIEVIAGGVLDALPDELAELTEDLTIQVEDFPDETTEIDMELEDPYELLALYKSGKMLTPGVEKKVANDDDFLVLYRRPILDLWCETGEDLIETVRHVIIEEIARHHEFPDEDIEEMTDRHYQGLL